MDSIIRIEDLVFEYPGDEEVPGYTAIDGVSLEIERGSFVAVCGPNGSGKSTLAKNLNALLVPTSGRILVNGLDTSDADNVWEVRKTVGMVFQNPDNQLVSSVVEDDVAFGPENLGIPPEEIRKRVDDALKTVGMYEFRTMGPHLLSGGQKQRIAIAGAIAMQSECIVFDEPTAMLDPSGRREIIGMIEDLHRSGKTVILITHFMEEAARAGRLIIMDRGKVCCDAAPGEVFSRGELLRSMRLELPFAAELAARLRARGIDVPQGIIAEKELADWICASL